MSIAVLSSRFCLDVMLTPIIQRPGNARASDTISKPPMNVLPPPRLPMAIISAARESSPARRCSMYRPMARPISSCDFLR
jgi:hypothetical protein